MLSTENENKEVSKSKRKYDGLSVPMGKQKKKKDQKALDDAQAAKIKE